VVTENGVFRYEGVRFREFTPAQGLPPSVTASIGEGPDGAVLVGNQLGLFRLRGEKFEKVPLAGNGKVNGYNSILLDRNRTWIGTTKASSTRPRRTAALLSIPGRLPPFYREFCANCLRARKHALVGLR